MGWLDKLLFWRDDTDLDPGPEAEFGVDGCFTLPGAELPADDCEAPDPVERPDPAT